MKDPAIVRTATMRASMVADVCVFVHTATSPTDAEWEQVIAFCSGPSRKHAVKVLVHTQGGAPNAAQRARYNQVLGGLKQRVAVLTPSAVARAAGTALTWFNPGFRVLASEDTSAAFDHLDIPLAERAKLIEAVAQLTRELGAASR